MLQWKLKGPKIIHCLPLVHFADVADVADFADVAVEAQRFQKYSLFVNTAYEVLFQKLQIKRVSK